MDMISLYPHLYTVTSFSYFLISVFFLSFSSSVVIPFPFSLFLFFYMFYRIVSLIEGDQGKNSIKKG